MVTVINSVADLQNMNLDLTGDYELGGDIDASATVGWNGGKGFDPIGNNDVLTPAYLRPTGDHEVTGVWTVIPGAPATLWDKVDEVVSDDDTTYIRTAVNDSRVLFSFTSPSLPVILIDPRLYFRMRVRRDGAGTATIQRHIQVGGVLYDIGNPYSPRASYSTVSTNITTNPATGLPWTRDELMGVGANALEKIGLTVSDASPAVRVTQFWTEIRSYNYFVGSLEGNGHHITNLYINRDDRDEVALFGFVAGGLIHDVHLRDVNIRGFNTPPASAFWIVGALVAWCGNRTTTSTGADIRDCSATGYVTCHYGNWPYVGGLFGYFSGSNPNIEDVHSICQRCWADIEVIVSPDSADRDRADVGGFAGNYYHSEIDECFALGNVTISRLPNGDVAGGFAGRFDWGATGAYSNVKNCYARGDIIVNEPGGPGYVYTGGFVAFGGQDTGGGNSETTNCYSTGAPSYLDESTFTQYGFGSPDGIITACFWDTEASGVTDYDPIAGIEGKTTDEMQDVRIFWDAGWDFDRWFSPDGPIWIISPWYGPRGVYPELAWVEGQWFK